LYFALTVTSEDGSKKKNEEDSKPNVHLALAVDYLIDTFVKLGSS
jgi:hypothetical protein